MMGDDAQLRGRLQRKEQSRVEGRSTRGVAQHVAQRRRVQIGQPEQR